MIRNTGSKLGPYEIGEQINKAQYSMHSVELCEQVILKVQQRRIGGFDDRPGHLQSGYRFPHVGKLVNRALARVNRDLNRLALLRSTPSEREQDWSAVPVRLQPL